MSPRLLPCPDCARHVRANDLACPFCGAPTSFAGAAGAPLPTPPSSMSRTARLAAGAVVAGMVAITGCGDDGTPPADSGTADSGPSDSAVGDATADTGAPDSAIAPPYGAPPEDSGVDSGTADVGVAPPYGAPPEDGG